MLHEEVEKYINLSGDKEAWQNTSISRIGGYLDGYDRGLEALDEIRAEVEQTAKDYDKFDDCRRVHGLWIALEIIDKYKEKQYDSKRTNK